MKFNNLFRQRQRLSYLLVTKILIAAILGIVLPSGLQTPASVLGEPLEQWEWRNLLPQGNYHYGINWINELFMAADDNSHILSSTMGSELGIDHKYAVYYARDKNLPQWLPDTLIPDNGFVIYLEDCLEDQDHQQLRVLLDNLPPENWNTTLKADGYEAVQARLTGSVSFQNPHRFVAQLLPDEIDKMEEGVSYKLQTVKASGPNNLILPDEITLIAGEINNKTSKISADPEKGFHWDYYLYMPDSVANNSLVYLMVGPNNTGTGSDDLQVHDDAAYQMASSSWKTVIAKELGTPLLVPVFPRPYTEWWYYTHALNRATMMIDDGPLERIDLQLIAMIEDAKDRIASQGINVEDRIFMNGFSACGTFSNRFTIMHPQLVRAVASGGISAIPTFPTSEWAGYSLRYPVGIEDIDEIADIVFDYKQYSRVAQYIYMGSEDDNDATLYDDAFERVDAELIWELVGLDMGERWNNSAQIYNEMDIPAQFETYEGVGHELNSEIIDDVIAFFKANSEPMYSFTDVTPNMQFYPYIEAIYAVGITTGYGDGTFRPNDPVNRGQMAAFIARALDLPDSGDPNNPSFTDVPSGMQFFDYIEAIYEGGITTGYGDGTFGPDDPVNRGQMAAFLSRALDLPDSGDANNRTFKDVSPTMQFFGYIEAIYTEDITTGYSDGTFRPDDPVTRGQMAAFISRALDL